MRRLIPGASDGWVGAGVDEFLRCYLTPRGRTAFYEAARNIYMDEPNGDDGFWPRWRPGVRHDVRLGTPGHAGAARVQEARGAGIAAARHVELDCGHVPQLELPRETHAAIRDSVPASR